VLFGITLSAATTSRGTAQIAASGRRPSASTRHGGRTSGKAGETSALSSVRDAHTATHYEAQRPSADTAGVVPRHATDDIPPLSAALLFGGFEDITMNEPIATLPSRIIQIVSMGFCAGPNNGDCHKLIALCEDGSLWGQWHSMGYANVPTDGLWYPNHEPNDEMRDAMGGKDHE
jgi:hypothetical protein